MTATAVLPAVFPTLVLLLLRVQSAALEPTDVLAIPVESGANEQHRLVPGKRGHVETIANNGEYLGLSSEYFVSPRATAFAG